MSGLNRVKAAEVIHARYKQSRPTIGICIGMQVLFADSDENGAHAGIKIWPTSVSKLYAPVLPHMGWNTLTKTVDHALLQGLSPEDYVYFVHSFAVAPSEFMLASCDYGSRFAAIIGKGNYLGMQFHPERSSTVGRKLLQNFIALSAGDLAIK